MRKTNKSGYSAIIVPVLAVILAVGIFLFVSQKTKTHPITPVKNLNTATNSAEKAQAPSTPAAAVKSKSQPTTNTTAPSAPQSNNNNQNNTVNSGSNTNSPSNNQQNSNTQTTGTTNNNQQNASDNQSQTTTTTQTTDTPTTSTSSTTTQPPPPPTPSCSGGYVDGNYCWYLGNWGQSCDSVCQSHTSFCVSGNWNDNISCSIGKSLTNYPTCQVSFDNSAPWCNPTTGVCYYRSSAGPSVSCSTSTYSQKRLCKCQTNN